MRSRQRFAARGILASAGAAPGGLHNSQFFLSLAPAIALDRDKHTIFGKIVGDSIYNLIKANEFAVDADERPLYPPVLERAEVIENPFADLRPRAQPPWKVTRLRTCTHTHAHTHTHTRAR